MIEQLKRLANALERIEQTGKYDDLDTEIDILYDIIREGMENIKNIQDGNFTR